jgi:hypothetical protein
MKLITELYDSEIEILTEARDDGGRDLYIKGIFAQSNAVNKNRRNYPKHVMEGTIGKYNREMVETRRALGELNHPASRLTVDPRECSHLITELNWHGNDVHGKARVLDTPMGKIVRGLLEGGANIGVSTRGAGETSLKENVNHVTAFHMTAIDAVTDPSAPRAFVEGIMENVEWVYNDGIWTPQQLDEARTTIKETKSADIPKMSIDLFEKFIINLACIK